MKEYRDIRDRHSFLDLCKDSDLACEVTVYAVERLGVDAAIIFSDILVLLEPMGFQLEFEYWPSPFGVFQLEAHGLKLRPEYPKK